MSALPPEADMLIVGINVRYVPIADIGWRLVFPELLDLFQAQTLDVLLGEGVDSAELCFCLGRLELGLRIVPVLLGFSVRRDEALGLGCVGD